VICLFCLSSPALADQTRTIAVYVVTPVQQAPTIDGDLSDPAWANAPVSSTYYEYWKPDPGPGALQTDLRMVYDAKGVYLAIVNHDPNVKNLRQHVAVRDDEALWTDDCAEIYFDPDAKAVGFTKFTVNSIGSQSDMRRVDAAVTDNAWSGYGWRTASKILKDGWTIEAFFPWSDLGAKAEPGSLWMFDHVRYAWSTGKFQGVTWAPGGNYNSTDKFGYLCFVGASGSGMEPIVQRLSQLVTPPWQMVAPNGLYVAQAPGQVRLFKPADLIRSASDQTAAALKKAQAAAAQAPDPRADKQLQKLKQESDALSAKDLSAPQALQAAGQLAQMRGEINDIYWQARLRALLRKY
jgi:hypothetical protein